MSSVITASIGVGISALGFLESKSARKAANAKADAAAEEDRKRRENVRVEGERAKFQAGTTNQPTQSANDFLNPLRIG